MTSKGSDSRHVFSLKGCDKEVHPLDSQKLVESSPTPDIANEVTGPRIGSSRPQQTAGSLSGPRARLRS